MQRYSNLLRAILPRGIKQGLKRVLGMPESRIHPDWKILESLEKQNSTHIVFDLGSRNGWFISNWKKWCPQATIHAFEPDQKAYQKLVSTYADDSDIVINPEGVGDQETDETFYHLGQSEVSSSFLKPDAKVWDEIKYNTGKIAQHKVKLTTLDAYCSAKSIGSIFLMKIDIQGYELKALAGATQVLKETDYLLIESSIKPLYEGAPRFTDVHQFLTEQGFHLMDFRAWHRGNQVLMETDMLFRRNSLAPEVSNDIEVDRYYIGHH